MISYLSEEKLHLTIALNCCRLTCSDEFGSLQTSEISKPTPVTESDRDEKKLAAPTANEKRLASAFANNALADVVQDFEKTLERSRTKSTSIERDSVCEQQEEARRRTCENRATTREKFFGEYGGWY